MSTDYTSQSMTDLIKTYNDAARKAGLAERKYFASKATVILAIENLTKQKDPAPVSNEKIVKKAKASKGTPYRPKKFRFGPVWVKSVKSGEGVAFMPTNRSKVEAHAEANGIPHAGVSTEDLAKEIAKVL